jgi:hypothetical protein
MKTLNVPERRYTPGTYDRDAPGNAAKKFIGGKATLTRVNWPAGVDYVARDGNTYSNIAVVCRFMQSEDNGATWELVTETGYPGGDMFGGKNGTTLITENNFTFSFTDPETGLPLDRTADLKLEMQVLVTLRTEIDVVLYEDGDVVQANSTL